MTWASGAVTDRGRVRPVNQDAFLNRPDLGLWAVADGMGGHSDGGLASRTIVEALAELERPTRLGTGVRVVRHTLQRVNAELAELASRLPDGDLIGSTAVVLLAVGRQAAVLWAGDSRAYRLRDGVLTALSADHSQVQALVDAGMLDAAAAEEHPMSNVLLRAVGSEDHLAVDGRIARLRPGERWLLCSDGIYRELDSPAMAALMTGMPPAETARALVREACELGARDNVTAVVVDILEAPL